MAKKVKMTVEEKYVSYQKDRKYVRAVLRNRECIQDIRKACDNQLGRKANKKKQALKEDRLTLKVEDAMNYMDISNQNKKMEGIMEKELSEVVKRFSIHDYLRNIKGMATIGIAYIVGNIDIYKAETVSKIWQYAGFNPSFVRGTKSITKKEYKEDAGEIIKELSKNKDGERRYAVLSNDLVKGDSCTKGFLAPYNKRFKAALIGIIAKNFVQQENIYYKEYYLPYKSRLQNSNREVLERKKGGKTVLVKWKDAKKLHIDLAARRKMIKHFLMDVYAEWRKLEGLSVREPYAEEYLGKKHSKKPAAVKRTNVRKAPIEKQPFNQIYV